MEEQKLISQSKLDLACGQNRQEGYFGIDVKPGEKVDAVVDLEQFPWPIESESADDIFCSHYVEHTPDLIKFMDEVYRILKPGGKIKVIAPYDTSMRCWQDPTHKRAISEATFLYYNAEWRKTNKLDHYDIKSDFDYTYGYDIAMDWANRSDEARAFAIRHYNNVINDIHVVLTKREIKK
ncbi:MAG: methyltransferase domain-containing protein [Bacteroidetes bacterium]|nr:methyltransferase domain-containing protein [Bacteroidota bacterium]